MRVWIRHASKNCSLHTLPAVISGFAITFDEAISIGMRCVSLLSRLLVLSAPFHKIFMALYLSLQTYFYKYWQQRLFLLSLYWCNKIFLREGAKAFSRVKPPSQRGMMRGSRGRTVIHTNAVSCNQDISLLLGSSTHTPLEIFQALSKDDALMIAPVSHEAGGIRHFSDICTFMSSMRTPPPPQCTFLL